MLESFLSDLCFIKDALDKDGETLFFDKEFSFFSSEPTLFYQPANDRIIYLNQRFTDEFGYTPKDIAAWSRSAQPLIMMADEVQAFIANMQQDEPDTGKKYHIFSKNGSQDIYQLKITPLYKGLFCIQFRDGQTKDYAILLQQKIEELNKSNAELEEFAYVASHDMQEPLRKISTFGQRLKNQCGDSLGDDGNLYLSRMLNASDNMRKLIDNLLEFSRVSRSKQPFEATDLAAILKNVREDLDLQIDEAAATISVDPLPAIEAIPSQMRQLFSNLLNNALKFRSKDRELVVQIKCRILKSPEIKKYDLPRIHSSYFLITMADNGIGFEQQYAERIFQLFQRLEGKSEYPGTGIGLSICRKIVQNHKGVIFAESKQGEGTVFSIILPKDQ